MAWCEVVPCPPAARHTCAGRAASQAHVHGRSDSQQWHPDLAAPRSRCLQVQLVNAQAKELERLRAQVMALRRKDTSVYN